MADNTVNIDDFKKEEKRRKRAKWFNDKCMGMQIWWSQNKDWAIYVIPVAVAGGTKIVRFASKCIRAHNQKKAMDEYYDRRVYDPQMGIKYTTKRTMTATDKENFTRLRMNGASVSDALKTLNLI